MIEGIDTSQLSEKIEKTLKLYETVQIQAVKLAHYYVDVLRARTPKKTGKTAESWTIHFHVVEREHGGLGNQSGWQGKGSDFP